MSGNYKLLQSIEHNEIRIIEIPNPAKRTWLMTSIALRHITKRRIWTTRTIQTLAMRTRKRSSHQRKRSNTRKRTHGLTLQKLPCFKKNINISWNIFQVVLFHQTHFEL